MGKYTGKKAVVIGGTIGIGLATVEALLDGGAEVLLTARNERNIEAARHTLGPRARVVRSDTSKISDIDALGREVEGKLSKVDFVFINAGVSSLTPHARITEDEDDWICGVDAKGAFFTVQRLAPLVREGGAIVFTTSVADVLGYPGMSGYSGAKAALRSMAQVLAAELLPRKIRVNAVSPGFIKTPTMGVSGSAEEIARAALFLAFEATFTTGIELPVDGGIAQRLVSAHP